ncbi:MAG: AI-2E family transporter [Alphaproteobacteria bacterium]
MTNDRRMAFWALGAVLALVALYVLRPVLLPFVAGMAVAYFLDPVADRLEKWGCSRTLATVIIVLGFILTVVAVGILVVPMLVDQVATLAARVPDYVTGVLTKAETMVDSLAAKLPPAERQRLAEATSSVVGSLLSGVGRMAAGVWSGGMAVVGVLSLLLITPVVAFYLLRDWDHMVAMVDGWLPRAHVDTIRAIMRDIDRSIAGFVRGQASVCLILGAFYGLGLTLVGLDVGLIIGVVTGLLSFIPYVGAITGFVVAMALALGQFHDWVPIGFTALVFLVGQVLEGNVLTPRLVGERIGLHPVWVMFALLAGGVLFGFVGILLAVPGAAVIGVLVRFAMGRYLEGPLYHGQAAAPAEQGEQGEQGEDPRPDGPVRNAG